MHGLRRSDDIVRLPAGCDSIAERSEEALETAPEGISNPMEFFASDLIRIADRLIDDLRVDGSVFYHNYISFPRLLLQNAP